MVLLSNVSVPTDGIRLEANTGAHVQGQDLGAGTLYIAESLVSWKSAAGQGFCLEYPAISLHAVSRDLSAFPHECLYLMVDAKLDDGGHENGHELEEEEDSDSTGNITEVRFVPDDKESLDNLFRTMSDCQALHPDPEDSFSSDDDFYGDAEDADHLNEEGQSRLEHMENIFNAGDGIALEMEPQIGAQAHNLNGDVGEAGDEAMETGQFDDAD